jgi:tetratricopeptide (TPR) repeat protein
MSNSLDVSISPWSLGLHSPVLRRPMRPIVLRHGDFDDKYDFHTVFYDCFWSADGKSLKLIGPALMNLEADLKLRFFAMPGGEELTPVAVPRVFITELNIKAPRKLQALRIESSAGTAFVVPQPNLSSLFEGRRVLMTLSQNNELEWIRDWIIWHQRLHGCDAVLVYDNNSTRYDVSELKGCLASIPGITGLALNWPFRYGPFDGRLPLTYDLWEGHFSQFGMLEHARYRFLTTARCALNLDIDELVTCPGGKSICKLTEASPRGHLKFSGKWVETHRSSGTDPASKPLHRDFWHRKAERTQGCENKYAVVPSRVPDSAQFGVHDIFGYVDSKLPDGIELRHFKALNTNWSVDRPGRLKLRTDGDPVDNTLAPDEPLADLLGTAFAGVKRALAAPPTRSKDTAVYQSRQRSAYLLRNNQAEAADDVARKAIAAAPDWPALRLYRATILDKAGDAEAARREREEAQRLQELDGRPQFDRGRYLMHTGDWGGAARSLHRAIRIRPRFAAPSLSLARLYWAMGRHRAAEQILRIGLRRAAPSALLHQAMAEVLASTGRRSQAIEQAGKAITLDPYNENLYHLRARLLREHGKPAEALADIDKAIALLGDPHLHLGQINAAIDRPFDVSYPSPDQCLAKVERVRCLLQKGDLKTAGALSQSMVEDYPNQPYPHEACYLALISLGQKAAAKKHLKEALAIARRNLDQLPAQTLGRHKERDWYESRLMYLWYLLHVAECPEDATDILRQGLQFYPDSHFIAMRLGDTLMADASSPEFKSLIESGIKRFPREPRFWSEHARLLEADGDKPGAIAAFRRAIGLGMKQPWIMSHLAYLIIDRPERSPESLAEAKELLLASLALDDTSALSHYRLGEVLWAEEKKTEAVASWRKAAELAPDTAWIWSHLGGQLVEAGELAEAQPALKRAERLQPDNMLTQFRIGRLAERQGNVEEALKRVARALTIDPGQPWVWHHYANLLMIVGRMEEAEKALEKAGVRG